MKKLVIICLLMMFAVCGCRKPHAIVLFNSEPITEQNVVNNEIAFKNGNRIYYIFMTDKPINSHFIRVQIIKHNESVERGGLKIVYSKDARLYKKEIYFYTSYVVLYENGHYILRVFDKDNTLKELARGNFWIRD